MEELTIDVTRGADRGHWAASVKPNGVVWTKNGQHVADVPSSTSSFVGRQAELTHLRRLLRRRDIRLVTLTGPGGVG